MKILLLSPYPPYPPRGGGTMRIYQIIRGLAQRHTLTCLTFAPDAAAEQALAPLGDLCRVVAVRGLRRVPRCVARGRPSPRRSPIWRCGMCRLPSALR